MTLHEAYNALLELVREGWLIGVEVFGTDDCCEHRHEACPSDGFGLCDVMHAPHSVGSDCNRAEPYLMRPHDALMTPELRAEFEDNWDTYDWSAATDEVSK